MKQIKLTHNKKGVELTINFIVTLILALAAFALGAVIIKTLTSGGVDSISLTQSQLNDKISQLSCSSRDKICISNNNKVVQPGDLVVAGLAVYNVQNSQVALQVTVEPKRAYKPDGSQFNAYSEFGPPGTLPILPENMPSALYTTASLTVNPKTQGQIAIGIVTHKNTPKGTYLFRVAVTEDTTNQNVGFQDIGDEISITVK